MTAPVTNTQALQTRGRSPFAAAHTVGDAFACACRSRKPPRHGAALTGAGWLIVRVMADHRSAGSGLIWKCFTVECALARPPKVRPERPKRLSLQHDGSPRLAPMCKGDARHRAAIGRPEPPRRVSFHFEQFDTNPRHVLGAFADLPWLMATVVDLA